MSRDANYLQARAGKASHRDQHPQNVVGAEVPGIRRPPGLCLLAPVLATRALPLVTRIPETPRSADPEAVRPVSATPWLQAEWAGGLSAMPAES
jgi:hypothetical protein